MTLNIDWPFKNFYSVLNLDHQKYSDYINCYFVSEKRALEIVSSLANKKDAILKIADLENIKKENVFTVGDNDTDYNMLKHFNGYIMKKSSKKWAF